MNQTGGLLTALRAIQSKFGYLPPETEAAAADAFNLSQAEVIGVISFYSDFHRSKPEGTIVRVCAAEACQAAGSKGLQAALEIERHRLGPIHSEPVYCLGLCSVGPAALVGDELIGKADSKRLVSVIERHQRGDT